MTKLDGFESRLLQALIEIEADGAGRPGPSAAAVEHRETKARRKRRFPSNAVVVPVVAVMILRSVLRRPRLGCSRQRRRMSSASSRTPAGGREGHRFREGGQSGRDRRPRCLRGPDLERRFLSVLRARPAKRPNRHILHPAGGTPWRGGVQRATRHRRRTAVRAGGR
jgi:hypothetical protein